MLELSHL